MPSVEVYPAGLCCLLDLMRLSTMPREEAKNRWQFQAPRTDFSTGVRAHGVTEEVSFFSTMRMFVVRVRVPHYPLPCLLPCFRPHVGAKMFVDLCAFPRSVA